MANPNTGGARSHHGQPRFGLVAGHRVGDALWSVPPRCYRDAVTRSGFRLLTILLLALAAAPAWAHGPRGLELRVAPLVEPAGVVPSSPQAARSPASAERLERSVRRAAGTRSAVGLAEAAGVLIAAGGLAGFGWFSRRDRRMAVAAATAGLVLGFVVETTPHLVHHALDRDKGASCEVLQTVERSPMAADAPDVSPTPAPAPLIDTPSSKVPPALAAPAPCGRAPPA
jgi:hypothetical protein